MSFLLVSKILHILLATKVIKIRPLCIFFAKLGAYKIDFNETECMCFMIKQEKFFIK